MTQTKEPTYLLVSILLLSILFEFQQDFFNSQLISGLRQLIIAILTMRVQQITEEYQLDHDLNITNHHREEKVYNIKAYRRYNFNNLNINNDQPDKSLQFKNYNNNQKEHSQIIEKQENKNFRSNCEQQNVRSSNLKSSYNTSAVAFAYNKADKQQKLSVKMMVLMLVAVLIIFLIIVEKFFPESHFNVLKIFTLDVGKKTRIDDSL